MRANNGNITKPAVWLLPSQCYCNCCTQAHTIKDQQFKPQHDPSGFDSHFGSLGTVNRTTNVYFQLPLSSKRALFSLPSLCPLISAAILHSFTFIRAKSEHIRLMLQDISARTVGAQNGKHRKMEMIGISLFLPLLYLSCIVIGSSYLKQNPCYIHI